MLTLNRKAGESILLTINDQSVKVLLSELHKGYENISIDAPEEIFILKEELK